MPANKVTVIYHGGGCFDGFCAAWLFRTAFPDAELVPAQHGDAPPDVTGKEVYVVDFSYRRSLMLHMVAQCRGNLVVLDHHKTAEAELSGLCRDCDRDALDRFPLVAFDQRKSGARLAWEHLYANRLLPAPWLDSEYTISVAPWLVDYTEDRDLWLWKLPKSREINAALRSHPFDFALWERLRQLDRTASIEESRLVDDGRAILRAEAQVVATHVRNATEVEIDGHKVLAVNATTLTSEIAGELAAGRPFGACYFDRADGFRVWSLRSRDGAVDVSEVAKKRGGGGHRNAAGFQERAA